MQIIFTLYPHDSFCKWAYQNIILKIIYYSNHYYCAKLRFKTFVFFNYNCNEWWIKYFVELETIWNVVGIFFNNRVWVVFVDKSVSTN